MEAFAWISYGEVEVYLLETKEQRDKVKELLTEVLVQSGQNLSENSTWEELLTAAEDERYSGNDSFQYGTGIITIKE